MSTVSNLQSETELRREELRGLFTLGLLAILVVIKFQNEKLPVTMGQSSLDLIPWLNFTIILWSLYAFFMVLGLSSDVIGKNLAETFWAGSKLFLQVDFIWSAFLGVLYFILGYPTRSLWILGLTGATVLVGILLWLRKKKLREIWQKPKVTKLDLIVRVTLFSFFVFLAMLFYCPDEQYLVVFFVLGLVSFVVFALVKEKQSKEKNKSSDNASEIVKDNNPKSRVNIKMFSKIVYDFRRILSVCALILVSSIALYIGFSVYPPTNSILAASRTTPWGIITSIFVHSSPIHLAYNMVGLFAYTLLFVICNSSLTSETKRRIQSFFLVCAFGSAIASNVFWVFLTSQPSLGASGVVYAVQGVLLGFSLINGLSILNWKKFKTQEKSTKLMVLFNLLVLISLLSEIFLSPQIFLSVAVGVNIVAHGLSFYLSLVTTFVWNNYVKKVSILV